VGPLPPGRRRSHGATVAETDVAATGSRLLVSRIPGHAEVAKAVAEEKTGAIGATRHAPAARTTETGVTRKLALGVRARKGAVGATTTIRPAAATGVRRKPSQTPRQAPPLDGMDAAAVTAVSVETNSARLASQQNPTRRTAPVRLLTKPHHYPSPRRRDMRRIRQRLCQRLMHMHLGVMNRMWLSPKKSRCGSPNPRGRRWPHSRLRR
jgi:hypothetical protein